MAVVPGGHHQVGWALTKHLVGDSVPSEPRVPRFWLHRCLHGGRAPMDHEASRIHGMDGAPPPDQPHQDPWARHPHPPFAKGSAMAETRKLCRSRSNRQVAGVCGGLSQYFNLDAALIRILFVVLAVLGGSGLLLYVLLWIIVPQRAVT